MSKFKYVLGAILALSISSVFLGGCSTGDDLKPEKEDPALKDMPAAPPDASMGAEVAKPGKGGN